MNAVATFMRVVGMAMMVGSLSALLIAACLYVRRRGVVVDE